GPGSQWYVAPSTSYGSQSLDSFLDGRRVRRWGYTSRVVSFVLGRELGTWGDIQIGVLRGRAGARSVIPETPDEAALSGYGTTQFIGYRADTLDSLGFPSRGYLIDARLERLPSGEPGQVAGAQSSLVGMSAFRAGDWAGHVYGEFARAKIGASPLSLGGFLRLSGSAPDSIQGRSVAFARLVMARRIGALPVTLGGTVRAGFSIEAGGGFDQDVPLRETLFKQAVSGFVSVDTRFGPAYVGAGATKDGARTVYLFLGPIW
ncbi:MAG: patatin domain-containing protein, partial [Telluria sp.]|nr:patatin domain-containing protein [Telluria sp.]